MEETYILNLIKFINDGKIVSFPTETVYALSCDANNQNAIENIYRIKNRNKNKLFSIFLDFALLDSFVYYESKFKNLVKSELSKGTTIIFNKKNKNILPYIHSDTIGIRIPKHSFTKKLLKTLQKPLVATSVNLSGNTPLCSYEDIKNSFPQISYILNNSLLSKSKISGKPSKIISLVGGNEKIIRQ